jgi:outer membrane receptor protein involved in Fe transport
MKIRHALSAGVALCTLASPLAAQDETNAAAAEGEASEIIVTAVARGQNRLESSVSVSTIGAEAIANLAAPSSADLIRQVPGIRSEASGGEGNANIAVRGIPVSTGGARYIQLQEDGLPILEFGDIIFGNADNFLRADRSVARVEAVRGGSASTFASNAPGAVINFISKTGQQQGGAIQGTIGLDFETYRLDFDYGAPLADDLYFHIGGFYRTGEGPRDIGYNGYDGGQIKANITKAFDGGYVRLSAKYLDDRTPTILPQPVRVTGTNGNPDYQAIAGFDPRRDSLYSPFLGPVVTLDGNNNPAREEPCLRDRERDRCRGWLAADQPLPLCRQFGQLPLALPRRGGRGAGHCQCHWRAGRQHHFCQRPQCRAGGQSGHHRRQWVAHQRGGVQHQAQQPRQHHQ